MSLELEVGLFIQLKNVTRQKENITEDYNKEMEMMQKKANEQLKTITTKHDQSTRLLEDREKELRAREAKNANEQRKLDYEKRMVSKGGTVSTESLQTKIIFP